MSMTMLLFKIIHGQNYSFLIIAIVDWFFVLFFLSSLIVRQKN